MSRRLSEGRRRLLVDVVAAVALTVITQYEVWTNDGVAAPLAAQSACFAAATLSLVGRRLAPLLALVVASAALTVQTAAGRDRRDPPHLHTARAGAARPRAHHVRPGRAPL